jgi:hypothetical protein
VTVQTTVIYNNYLNINSTKMNVTIRQNFHQEVEAGINKQINMELRASYIYQSMVKINSILS